MTVDEVIAKPIRYNRCSELLLSGKDLLGENKAYYG